MRNLTSFVITLNMTKSSFLFTLQVLTSDSDKFCMVYPSNRLPVFRVCRHEFSDVNKITVLLYHLLKRQQTCAKQTW